MIERTGVEKSPEAFRTIGEAAADLDLPQHVLRFWETRFPQVKPLKRAGGRRFYRPEDVALLRAIKLLLYGQGYTIKGVQRLLQDHGPRGVAATLATPSVGVARSETPHQGGDTTMTDDDRTSTDDGADAGRRQRRASGGSPSPIQRPARTAMRAEVLERLEALSLDLADCARVLVAAQSGRGRL